MKTIHKLLIPIIASLILIASLYTSDYLMRDSKLFAPKESKLQFEIAKTNQYKLIEV